ncbi:MAG: hypothetical protein V5A60_16575, partial [Haloarculaceae archaeon]
MRQTRRAVLGAAAAMTTGLAGCTGGGTDCGGGADATPTASPTDDPLPTASATPTGTSSSSTPATDATVRVRALPDPGEILVGPEGRTLYMFDRDTEGERESACRGDCAEAWPPLTVDEDPTAGGEVTATLSAFEREGGGTQVAAGGWPLYYFANDEAPGDATG